MRWLHQQQHPCRVDANPSKLHEREGHKAFRHQFYEQEIGSGHQMQKAGDEAH